LDLVAIASDFKTRRSPLVNTVGIPRDRRDKISAVSHTHPVCVDDQQEIIKPIYHYISESLCIPVRTLGDEFRLPSGLRDLQCQSAPRGFDTVWHKC
jgi:hypothetical protein